MEPKSKDQGKGNRIPHHRFGGLGDRQAASALSAGHCGGPRSSGRGVSPHLFGDRIGPSRRRTLQRSLTKLSRKGAEARLEGPVDIFSNLEMYFAGKERESVQGTLYGKVVGSVPGTRADFTICFTSVPPEIEVFLGELLAQAAEAQPKSPVRKTPKRRRSPLRKNGRALPSGPAVS